MTPREWMRQNGMRTLDSFQMTQAVAARFPHLCNGDRTSMTMGDLHRAVKAVMRLENERIPMRRDRAKAEHALEGLNANSDYPDV